MTSCRSTSRSRAFTLIEVLVVVAIIALLVAILVPSLARARSVARSTQCRSQIRQVVVAINEYTAEWKEVFPRGASPNEVHWTRLIARIFGEKTNFKNINELNVERFEPFHCPERTPKLPHAFVDYVVNALSVDGPDPGTKFWEEVNYSKMSEYKRPADVVYLADAEHELSNIGGASTLTLKQARENWKSGVWRTNPNMNGVDAMDIWKGDQLPQGNGSTNGVSDKPGPRRVGRKMHLNRWTNCGFLDGHTDGLQMENKPKGYATDPESNYSAWLRHFGVNERAIRGVPGSQRPPAYQVMN